jgi:hypothetical protein
MKTPKNTTIIFVTSNTEDEIFETKIREIIKENSGGLPIISISRKPIKFGKNICIGEESSISDSTTYRQILKGLLKAKTDFVVIAKPNYLYPPEYFSFLPPTKTDIYKYTNIWVLASKYWQKGFSESTFMSGRKHLITLLKAALLGHRGWKAFTVPPLFDTIDEHAWSTDNPVLIVRTGNGRFPSVLRNVLPKINLPFWGLVTDLKQKLGIS